jgi:predicted dehydrogenase
MRVLFIGYGSIARKHHEALKQLFDGDLTCFALRSSRQPIDINGVQSISDWNRIPRNIDFAIVSTPTSKHVDSIKELIKRQIPVFLEKPIRG